MSAPATIPPSFARDLARCLDPVELAIDAGLEPDDWQTKALRSMAPKSLWCCARQTGKSTIASLKGIHTGIYDPGLVIMVSPSQNQSAELLKKAKDHLGAIKDRPEIVSERQFSVTLANGSQLLSLPGSEATVRGYSKAKLVIVDEAARVEDALLAAVRPMRATTRGRFLALSTPAGKRGWWFEAWDHGEGYERFRVTAAECPRITKEFLDEERRDLGELRYQAEYECIFAESDSQLLPDFIIDRALSSEVEPLWPQ